MRIIAIAVALTLPVFSQGRGDTQEISSSGRDIPVVLEKDVLVAGGSTGGVAAALAAAQAGARVFLFSNEPYLGADVCGSLRLWLEPGEVPDTPLAKAMFAPPEMPATISKGLALTYTTDVESGGGHPDSSPPGRLADGQWGNGARESVEYGQTVTIVADLGSAQDIGQVRVMVYHRKGDIETRGIACSLGDNGQYWDAQVSVSNPAATIQEEHIDSPVILTIPVSGRARYVRVVAERAENVKRQLLGEIVVEGAGAVAEAAKMRTSAPLPPQPMQIKRALEQALLDAGVQFLYGCYVSDALVDGTGALRGLVMANRNGRQAVLAHTVIDATQEAVAARVAGATFRSPADEARQFSRVVFGGDASKAKLTGMPLPSPLLLDRIVPSETALCPAVQYTMRIPAVENSMAALAVAEQQLRDATWTPGQLGASDSVFAASHCAIVSRKQQSGDWPGAAALDLDALRPAGVDHLYVLGGCADISGDGPEKSIRPLAYMTLGTRTGEAAAHDAVSAPQRKVVCLGDSITAGGYPRRLEAMLDRVAVHNAGIGGDTSEGGRRRCADAMAMAGGAAAVVIMFGTNDSVMTGPGQYRVPVARYAENLRATVAECRAAGAVPVICAPPRIIPEPYYTRHDRAHYDPVGGIQSVLNTYQNAARAVAAETGALYTDMGSALDACALRADGVHPNRHGERQIASAVAATLTKCAGFALRDAPDTLRTKASGVTIRCEAGSSPAGASDTRESLNGLRPASRAGAFVPEPARSLPVLGEYDVVVAGGGTGGAPAGISAAREGARTLVIECLHGLGGIGTLGLIGKYYYGNRTGFTAEVDEGVAALTGIKEKGGWDIEGKMEWFRRELRAAGAEIWFGCVVCGTFVMDGKVSGVVVATPFGRGVVLAKNVIDATGNADVAYAAGAGCVYVGGDDIAVQGTGMPPRQPGVSYRNTDYTMSDPGDPVDSTRTFLSGRDKYAAEFDLGQIIDSRERRRIAGDFTVSPLDLFNQRTYSDSVVFSSSNFDSHGFTVHNFFLLKPPHRDAIKGYTPYRSLLPKGLDGLLVIGLGVSAHRDAMPILRMQPDIQNGGYAAGLAAAMASSQDKGVRAVDVRALQRRLVEKGCLPATVLEDQDSAPPSDAALMEVVGRIGNDYDGIPMALTEPERALPLLREALRTARQNNTRLVYAHVLGILGDPSGADILAAEVARLPWDEGWNFTGGGQYGMSMSPLDSLIVALGRTRSEKALKPILDKMASLDATAAFSHHRAVAMALESLGAKDAVPALAALMQKPDMAGYAVTDAVDALEDASPADPNLSRNRCMRELILARALYRCGDKDGLGETILREYATGLYSHYALHAVAILGE